MTGILVLGGNGFLGRSFRRYAASQAGDVDAVAVADIAVQPTTRTWRVDLSDFAAVDHLLGSLAPRYIVNLVGVVDGDAAMLETINVALPRHLLARAASMDALRGARVMLVGSAAEYGGESDAAQDEQTPLRPTSDYAASKVRQYVYFRESVESTSVDAVLVRPFNIIGPGMPSRLSLPTFARRIDGATAGDCVQTGSLGAIRDYIDVGDAAAAFWCALTSGVRGEVYNVCSGRGRSMRSIVERMVVLSGKSVRICEDPTAHPGVLRSVGSAAKLAAATHWAPTVPFDESLRSVLDHERA